MKVHVVQVQLSTKTAAFSLESEKNKNALS